MRDPLAVDAVKFDAVMVGFIDALFGRALAMLLVLVGLIGWAFSAWRDMRYLAVAAAGAVLFQFPGMLAHYMGVSCV